MRKIIKYLISNKFFFFTESLSNVNKDCLIYPMSACVTSSQSIFECNEPKTTSTHNHISLENTCLELIIPQVEIPITSPSTVILNADLNPSNSSIPKISSNKNSLLSPMKLALCKKFKNKIVKKSQN